MRPAPRALVGRVADAHRATAEHVGRPHEHGVSDPLCRGDGLLGVAGDRPVRRAQPELGEQVAEALAVLGEVDGRGLVPRIGTPALDQPARQLERRLPAELHDDADRPLALTTSSTSSAVSGSKYSRSAVS